MAAGTKRPRRTALLIGAVLILAACADDTFQGESAVSSTGAVATTTTTTTLPETTTTTTTTTTTLPETTTTTTTPPAESCSAQGYPVVLLDEPGLPAPVDDMRRRIVDAALACDFERLAALAIPGGFEWTWDPRVTEGPAEFWAERDPAIGTLRRLLRLLEFPAGVRREVGVEIYAWPAVAAYDDWASAPEADRAALGGLFTPEDMERFELENYYLGSRVFIDATGNWLGYVPGEGN